LYFRKNLFQNGTSVCPHNRYGGRILGRGEKGGKFYSNRRMDVTDVLSMLHQIRNGDGPKTEAHEKTPLQEVGPGRADSSNWEIYLTRSGFTFIFLKKSGQGQDCKFCCMLCVLTAPGAFASSVAPHQFANDTDKRRSPDCCRIDLCHPTPLHVCQQLKALR